VVTRIERGLRGGAEQKCTGGDTCTDTEGTEELAFGAALRLSRAGHGNGGKERRGGRESNEGLFHFGRSPANGSGGGPNAEENEGQIRTRTGAFQYL
jgi:hypothetical protein